MRNDSTQPNVSIAELIKQYNSNLESSKFGGMKEYEYLRMIDYYDKTNNYESAYACNYDGLCEYPMSYVMHRRMINLQLDNFSFTFAEEALEEMTKLFPINDEISVLLLKLNIGLKRFDVALEIIANLQQVENLKDELLSEVYWAKGQVHESKTQYEQKYFCLKEALLLNPDNARALEEIQAAAELSNNNKNASKLYHRLLVKDAYKYRLWYNLGNAYLRENQVELALEAFEFAFELNERFELAYLEYVELSIALKRYDLAFHTLKKMKGLFTLSNDSLFQLGKCHFYRKEYDKAKVIFYALIKAERGMDEAYFMLGKCYQLESDYTSAAYLYNKAISLNTMREDYYAALGDVNVEEYKFNKANYNYGKAAATAPENSFYWAKHARFLMKIGNLDRAFEVLTLAENTCSGGDILYCKAVCLFTMGKRKKALKTLENALIDYYDEHKLFFKIAPEKFIDKQVADMITYYKLQE